MTAIAFLEDFSAPPWTLVAWRGERWMETMECRTQQEAAGFLNKHRRAAIGVLLGRTMFAAKKDPQPGDFLAMTAVAVGLPWKQVDALPLPPAILLEGHGRAVAAWRFLTPMNAATARRALADFARRCGCEPLMLTIPVPHTGSGFELVYQRKGETIDLLDLNGGAARKPRPAQSEDQDERFVRGDQAQAGAGLPVIKKGWVPAEAITLFLGPPKQGKSLGVAKLASYITSGGSWEPGGWRAGWWDGAPVAASARGSVIVCEEEDPRLETLARLKAAGCDMAKVHVRMLVPEIGLASKLKQIIKLADDLGDCRMISFSPFSSALRLRNYTEDAVREKIRPIQAWVRGRGIAIIAIVHLDDEGRTSGSKVIPRVCRSGIKFEAGVMTVALANSAKMGVKLPFRIEDATVAIDGAQIDTARILFK